LGSQASLNITLVRFMCAESLSTEPRFYSSTIHTCTYIHTYILVHTLFRVTTRIQMTVYSQSSQESLCSDVLIISTLQRSHLKFEYSFCHDDAITFSGSGKKTSFNWTTKKVKLDRSSQFQSLFTWGLLKAELAWQHSFLKLKS
jgi:hypothetical protein